MIRYLASGLAVALFVVVCLLLLFINGETGGGLQ